MGYPFRAGLPSLDAIAGGAGFARLASTVLWVERIENEDAGLFETSDRGTICARWNRRVRILKARNGKGAGAPIGFWFDDETFAWVERGLVVSGKNSQRGVQGCSRASRIASDPTPREDVFR